MFKYKTTVRLNFLLQKTIEHEASKKNISKAEWIRKACYTALKRQHSNIVFQNKSIKIKVIKLR